MSAAQRTAIAAAILYVCAAILTFGHEAGGISRVCQRTPQQTATACAPDFIAVHGLMAGMVWPLYWSWELQS